MLSRPRACCLIALCALWSCNSEIVLGDREQAAGAPSPVPSEPDAGAGAGGSPSQDPPPPAPPPDDTPLPGDVLWSADHESGTIADWERGGEYYGGQYGWGDGSFEVVPGAGRDGSQGLVVTIDTAARGDPSQGVRFYRRIEAAPAFYTAWFRIEEAHTVSNWWSISLFHARDSTSSLRNDRSLWDIRVVDTPGGGMALQFFDHDTMLGTTAETRGAVTPGAWFELAIYLDYRPPDASRIFVTLNGVQLFDMKNLRTSVESNVFWAVGNGSGGLDPELSTLLLDDASVRSAAASR